MSKDDLGERMKENYELRTRYFLPRRTYSTIRLDGKSWHSYCRNLKKPFDEELIQDIDNAVIKILPQIQGAVFAYCQSDEISILLTDFKTPQTHAWFDGNIQKICSVSSSLMTAEFNLLRLKRLIKDDFIIANIPEHFTSESRYNNAFFDSRVFTIPDRIEVMNYFIWRNQDCSRNSVSMVAQHNFSHGKLQNKSCAEMQEMLFKERNINWSEYPEHLKNGRLIIKEEYEMEYPHNSNEVIKRKKWVSTPAWKFTQDSKKLLDLIPEYE